MKKIFLLFILALSLNAADKFIYSETPILDKIGGAKLGDFSSGAKVDVQSTKGKYSFIKYTGYVPLGSDVVYAKLGFLIQDLKVDDVKKLKIIKKVVDDYDNEWQEVQIQGYIPSNVLKDSPDEFYAQGEKIFKERCGMCHALHAYDEFSVNVWPNIIDSMAANSGLDKNEQDMVTRFVQSKAPEE